MGFETNRYVIGDCRETLRSVPDGTFQCCITSPPYLGLRDYGHPDQLGLEETPEEYVANLVGVFREVRRSLVDSGCLWLVLGDSYAGSWGAQSRGDDAAGNLQGSSMLAARQIMAAPKGDRLTGSPRRAPGLKPKDMIGVPWRVAFALQADGWWLRSCVIWQKPNSLPESVRDRPSKSYEHVFLLTKSASYFYDADAISEPTARGPAGSAFDKGKTAEHALGRASGAERAERPMRNSRDVWSIPTEPYSGAHFATMPKELVRRCILAGSAPGNCVLDPFLGSGTVGLVAESLDRRWFGCELNPDYAPLIAQRTAQVGMKFGAVK